MAQCVETNEHGYRCVLDHAFQDHVDSLGRSWPSARQYCYRVAGCPQGVVRCRCQRDESHEGECRCEHWSLSSETSHGRAQSRETAPAASASPAWEEAGFSSESAYDDYVRWLNDPRAGGG